jgi:predicted nuclease of predicted toxin-antitoxin system
VIRLLLDQGLPRSAASFLGASGYDALHVADIGLACASDAEIIEHARDTGRVIVTLDADFHRLLTVSSAARPAVIRSEGLRGRAVAELILRVIGRLGARIEQGACRHRHRAQHSRAPAAHHLTSRRRLGS